jgi:hypothetical protein
MDVASKTIVRIWYRDRIRSLTGRSFNGIWSEASTAILDALGGCWLFFLDMYVSFAERIGICDLSIRHLDREFLWRLRILISGVCQARSV